MYWRQVVSQSPTTADADQAVIDHYIKVWEPLNQRILTGSSFSGNERNCCFLNTGQTESGKDQFADVSAASALHHLDDSRSIAVTDWDQDGDLDLWITNRTSPRIRYLRNDTPTKNSYVAFQLEGLPSEKCPRDAYGARVEVTLADETGETLIKPLSPFRCVGPVRRTLNPFPALRRVSAGDWSNQKALHWRCQRGRQPIQLWTRHHSRGSH